MAIASRINFEKVYQDRGIRLTAERPIFVAPKPLRERLREIERIPMRRLDRYVEELKQYRREYPDLPVVRQVLYSTFLKLGKPAFAEREINEAIALFPHHLSTVANYINSIDNAERMTKAARYLGSKLEITHFAPREDGTYAWQDFLNYELTAVRLLAVTDQDYYAKKRLEYLIQIGADTMELRASAEVIQTFCDRWKVGGVLARAQYEKAFNVSVNARATTIPYRWEVPTFHHPEVAELYDLSDDWEDFGQTNVDRFLALPRATFIEDLRTVLRDVIIRNETLTEGGESYCYAFYHALGFLAVLEAEEALPDLMNTLRTDADFIDSYFGLATEDVLHVPLYLLGKNQPEVLYDFLLEPYRDGYVRATVASVLSLIALHEPAEKQEMVAYFQRLFRHLLAHADQPGLIDTDFITLAVTHATDLRAPELFPEIQALYERDWVMPSMMGDLYEIEANLHFPVSPYDRKPMPANMADYYSGAYRHQQITLDFTKYRSPVEKLLTSVRQLQDRERLAKNRPTTKQLEVTPRAEKVGRNAPCPCGSGRKYKQCCLRK